MNDISVRIHRDPSTEGVHIFATILEGRKRMTLDGHGRWHEAQEGFAMPVELCYIPGDYDLLQKLADALHEFGVTPHGYIPQRGEIEATERHLHDMRALVAKLTKTDLDAGPKPALKMRTP